MPIVDGKKFNYTKAGYKAAAKARRNAKKKNYSPQAIKMARKMYG